MTAPSKPEFERVPPEVADVLAERIRVLHAGGGDVDCAVRGVRPYWPLRLAEWRLCQTLRYDASARYYVLERNGETLALDTLDDPAGIGTYGFPTGTVFEEGGPGCSTAGDPARAAYLTLKRIRKGQAGRSAWEEIGALASVDLDEYSALLAPALGDRVAERLAADLLAGTIPAPQALDHWRSEQRRRRLRTPARAVSLGARAAHRIAVRSLRPTGLVVAIVGPDGAGKSSVADELPAACGQLFRRSLQAHVRPRVLPLPGAILRRPAADASRPHARAPHGVVVSTLLVCYHLADTLLAHAINVVPFRVRTGLVVLERGYLDFAVDPLRYRLGSPRPLLRAVGRLLPDPDLTVVLEGPAELLAGRTGELPPTETERQLEEWHRLLTGKRRVAYLDASRPLAEVVRATRDEIAAQLEAREAARLGPGWAALPRPGRPRLYLPRAPKAVTCASLGIRLPQTPGGRLRRALLSALAASGAGRLLPRGPAPPADVRRSLAPFVPSGCTYAVASTAHPGRFVALIVSDRGEPRCIAKIATDDHGRERLAAEAEALATLAPMLQAPLSAPTVLAAEPGVLVTLFQRASPRRRPSLLPPAAARAVGELYRLGGGGASGPAHGDFVPWNLLEVDKGEWLLVDWEAARRSAPPYFDVFHYLVQAHAMLGRPSRSELIAGLEGGGRVADAIEAYAVGAELTDDPRRRFAEYLSLTADRSEDFDVHPQLVAVRRALARTLGQAAPGSGVSGAGPA